MKIKVEEKWWEDEHGNVISEEVAKTLDNSSFHYRIQLPSSETVDKSETVSREEYAIRKFLKLIKKESAAMEIYKERSR